MRTRGATLKIFHVRCPRVPNWRAFVAVASSRARGLDPEHARDDGIENDALTSELVACAATLAGSVKFPVVMSDLHRRV